MASWHASKHHEVTPSFIKELIVLGSLPWLTILLIWPLSCHLFLWLTCCMMMFCFLNQSASLPWYLYIILFHVKAHQCLTGFSKTVKVALESYIRGRVHSQDRPTGDRVLCIKCVFSAVHFKYWPILWNGCLVFYSTVVVFCFVAGRSLAQNLYPLSGPSRRIIWLT